jgi:RHS repeat-associated protein
MLDSFEKSEYRTSIRMVNTMDYVSDRNYDPYSQRFLSEDPISFRGGDVNFYRYVFNNPMRFSDPTGKLIFTHGVINQTPGIPIFIQVDPNTCVTTSITNTFYYNNPGRQIDIPITDPETGEVSTGKGCIMICSGVVGIGTCREIKQPVCKDKNL